MDDLNSEVAAFWRKTAAMLQSGVPLLQALDTAYQEAHNEEAQQAIGGLAEGIRNGSALHEAAAQFPGAFPPTVQVMLRAGETGGIAHIYLGQV